MASTTIEDGQFDDTPEAQAPTQINLRSGHLYIDNSDSEPDHWSESAEEDDSEIDEAYDNNQVEDEDWEIAEGGPFGPLISRTSKAEHMVLQTSPNSITAFDSMSRSVQETRRVSSPPSTVQVQLHPSLRSTIHGAALHPPPQDPARNRKTKPPTNSGRWRNIHHG